MSRLVVVVGVLLVMLLVPLYLSKERADKVKAKAVDAAERAIDARASRTSAASAPAASTGNDPDRLGFTFGWLPPLAADELRASCHAAQRDLPTGACNLSAGDTSCRTVLPVLCLRPAEGDAPMALGTSAPVAGFLISGQADGDARCAQSLGLRWRMATYQNNGAELRAIRQPGTAVDTSARVWVAMKNQPAHCWDR
jgi:hypothetical protein